MQRLVLDSVEVRKRGYVGLHKSEGRSEVGGENQDRSSWRWKQDMQYKFDQAEPGELEVPN